MAQPETKEGELDYLEIHGQYNRIYRGGRSTGYSWALITLDLQVGGGIANGGALHWSNIMIP